MAASVDETSMSSTHSSHSSGKSQSSGIENYPQRKFFFLDNKTSIWNHRFVFCFVIFMQSNWHFSFIFVSFRHLYSLGKSTVSTSSRSSSVLHILQLTMFTTCNYSCSNLIFFNLKWLIINNCFCSFKLIIWFSQVAKVLNLGKNVAIKCAGTLSQNYINQKLVIKETFKINQEHDFVLILVEMKFNLIVFIGSLL